MSSSPCQLLRDSSFSSRAGGESSLDLEYTRDGRGLREVDTPLDQNLPRRLTVDLQSSFPGTSHVWRLGLAESSDEVVWDYAAEKGYAIVSKDTDFINLALLKGHPPKVIHLQIGNSQDQERRDLPPASLEARRHRADSAKATKAEEYKCGVYFVQGSTHGQNKRHGILKEYGEREERYCVV